jgi:hypothetical protein
MQIRGDGSYESPWLSKFSDEDGTTVKFSFNAKSIYLFASGPPCGDACLDILANMPENAVPWERPTTDDTGKVLHGHEYLWEKGRVRIKPGSRPLLPD